MVPRARCGDEGPDWLASRGNPKASPMARRQASDHASTIESMSACVASAGANPFTGTAAAMTVFPIVPDFAKYP